MKNLLKTFFSILMITQAYPQWIEHQLPGQYDVWGLENKDSVFFAGTEIGFQGPGYVFRSIDYGVTWDTVSGLPYAGGWCFDFSDSILVAGSFGWGISLSSDLGNTWTIPDSGIVSNENVHVIIRHRNYMFAGTAVNDNGVLRSSDNGRSWIQVNNGLPIGSYISLASNGKDLFTGMASTGEVFRSTDDGMSWFYAGNGLPANSHIATLAVKDQNVYAGLGSGEGVYYSSNSGENWVKISASVPIGQVWTLVLADSNLFVGSIVTGVFLTQDNGISWTTKNEGLFNKN
ncbi:MAG: WD40/YVTN/BNR-like repeat-containing protein, partial [Nitrososphaerales archaeon]